MKLSYTPVVGELCQMSAQYLGAGWFDCQVLAMSEFGICVNVTKEDGKNFFWIDSTDESVAADFRRSLSFHLHWANKETNDRVEMICVADDATTPESRTNKIVAYIDRTSGVVSCLQSNDFLDRFERVEGLDDFPSAPQPQDGCDILESQDDPIITSTTLEATA